VQDISLVLWHGAQLYRAHQWIYITNSQFHQHHSYHHHLITVQLNFMRTIALNTALKLVLAAQK